MKPILFFLFALLAVNSKAQTVINDKNVQVRNVSAFSAIKVSGGIDVYLSQSNEEAVAVSASDESDRDYIKTEVKDGVLNIYSDSHSFKFRNRQLRAYVSFKTLESIEGSGATDFVVVECNANKNREQHQAKWRNFHQASGGKIFVVCDNRACMRNIRSEINYCLGNRPLVA